ncbi:hypothetical protein AB0J86_14095 [Micromonospora sp. NPDC049559]|uniref:hypothetical protein n=1 Tax=Micromonospora sp. NPDC049559 TaxID=3155923 RepID=UPI003439C85B
MAAVSIVSFPTMMPTVSGAQPRSPFDSDLPRIAAISGPGDAAEAAKLAAKITYSPDAVI